MPSPASRAAVAAPMPLDAPVTTATLPRGSKLTCPPGSATGTRPWSLVEGGEFALEERDTRHERVPPPGAVVRWCLHQVPPQIGQLSTDRAPRPRGRPGPSPRPSRCPDRCPGSRRAAVRRVVRRHVEPLLFRPDATLPPLRAPRA